MNMNMREKMIEEIMAEVAKQSNNSKSKSFSAEVIKETTDTLVDAFLGFQRKSHPNERAAANAIVTKIKQIIK